MLEVTQSCGKYEGNILSPRHFVKGEKFRALLNQLLTLREFIVAGNFE